MTLPGAMLVGISTPHKKSGLLFERYKKAPISAALLYRSSGHPEDVVYVCNTCGGDGYVRPDAAHYPFSAKSVQSLCTGKDMHSG